MRIKITHCKAQTAGNSEAIGKVCIVQGPYRCRVAHGCARATNAAVGDFKLIDAVHDLIRGSF